MTWTSEYPTQPGYYWLKNLVLNTWHGEGSEPGLTVVEMDKEGDFRRIADECTTFKHWVLSAQWLGPILSPDNELEPQDIPDCKPIGMAKHNITC